MVVLIIAVIADVIILVIFIQYFKFLIELVLDNITTLERVTLRNALYENSEFHKFNVGNFFFQLGSYNNWIQIFGRKSWAWGLPIFIGDEEPVGDGKNWVLRTDL